VAVFRDIRLAVRQLRRNLGFTAIVLVTLGLCIGANTAIYSVLDAVLLRPLPYPEPDRLAMVVSEFHQNRKPATDNSQTNALFQAVREGAPGLDAAACAQPSGVNFAAGSRVDYIKQQRVSAGFFRVLGVSPAYGREFTRAEDVPNGPKLAILSYPFWQRAFRSDPGAIGRRIQLRGEPYIVAGIMPRGFRTHAAESFDTAPTGPVDVWTPLAPSNEGEGANRNYRVIARLKPGVSWAEASGQLQALSRILMLMPGYRPESAEFEQRIVPYHAALTADNRAELLLTWAAVLVVLLIGCVNVASLLLARSAVRAREIATRLALGGSRAAIVRQLLIESLALALAGCAVGLLIGSFATDWLKRLGAGAFEVAHPIEVDGRVMGAMLALAVIASVVFGLAPAIQTSRLNIRSVLLESGRGLAGTRRQTLRRALIAGQVALSLMLLVSAGLLVRTVRYFRALAPGFDARDLIVAQSSLSDARYRDAAAVNRLFQKALGNIRAISGVRSAAAALTLPYERPPDFNFVQLDGLEGAPRGGDSPMVYVSPEYFATMRIPLLRGRGIQESDSQDANPVVVVSRSFAQRNFGAISEALGHHLAIGDLTREIVGVAGDVPQHSELGQTAAPIGTVPTIYLPVNQAGRKFLNMSHTWFSPKWVIRTAMPPGRIAPRIQAAVASVDPLLPIAHFRTIGDLEGVYLVRQRYLAALFSMLASLAAALAGIGLYGLISNTVVQRRYELGVRIAVGATTVHTIADVVKPAMLLVGIGIAAGAALASAASRLLQSMLWGVSPADPPTFLTAAAALALVAALASAGPALRLMSLDPARTLRNQE
jgi:predicted permease